MSYKYIKTFMNGFLAAGFEVFSFFACFRYISCADDW